MFFQALVLMACLAVGEIVVKLCALPIPSSILGMLLLTILLQLKVIKKDKIKSISDFLLSNLGFFFIPPGVALMLYFEVIAAEILPIAAATILSTILVLVATALTHKLLSKNSENGSDKQ